MFAINRCRNIKAFSEVRRSLLFIVIYLIISTDSLENGLARTPPMGWMSWERFRCNRNCRADFNNCLSEKLFMEIADRLAEDGFRDAGYQYLIIDDCWTTNQRSKDGKLVPDPERFPRGMKFLSDYIHNRGLKFGMYLNYGPWTCMGFPGTKNEDIETDAQTFASWNVDYVKMDGCYTSPEEQMIGYPEMERALNRTGRPMVFSCSWPYYDMTHKREPNWTALIQHCNLWRNFHDIRGNWGMINYILEYFGDNQEVIAKFAGPGHWNDPDMLMIGDYYKLTPDQAKAQMALWAILAAPLLMSNDLRNISKVNRNILQNKKVIEVNQDPLGIQGKRIYLEQGISIWTRPLKSRDPNSHSYAIAFINHQIYKIRVAVILKDLGLINENGYNVQNVLEDNGPISLMKPKDRVTVSVKPTAAVLLRAEAIV